MRTATLMDAQAIERALTRMAHEIVEHAHAAGALVFLGIRTNGVPLAHRLAGKVAGIVGRQIPVGEIDVSMHRDDLELREAPPVMQPSHIPFDVTGRTIVLVDDVLFAGRTIRAAMEEIASFGRPKRIQLAVLVDRGHRELPIRADYVGKNIPTAENERVTVLLSEVAGKDEVIIERPS